MSDGVLGVAPEELARVSRLIASTAAGLSSELGSLDSEVSDSWGQAGMAAPLVRSLCSGSSSAKGPRAGQSGFIADVVVAGKQQSIV